MGEQKETEEKERKEGREGGGERIEKKTETRSLLNYV